MILPGFEKLTDDNFSLYAVKCYQHPSGVSEQEFFDDLKKIKYVKRLFNRYRATGNLKERLILNHIIVLTNVFGVEHAVRMLFFKLEPAKHYTILKTFLVFLKFMPDVIVGVGNRTIISSDIPIDVGVVQILRQI